LQKSDRGEKYMQDIILVTGNTAYKITIDPTIWIFDERRFQLEERLEGTQGLAMELEPFIHNAGPAKETTKARIHLRNEEIVELSIADLLSSYVCFAIDNKPIKEGGPALLYLADGSNKENPVSDIREIELV
jgi:hypothetical protein